MKHYKNILALVLAIAMLLGCVTNAFAAEEKTAGAEQKGILSESFRELDVYSSEDIVRAIVLTENGNEAVIRQMVGMKFDLKFEYSTLLSGFSCDIAYGELERIAHFDGVSSVHVANSFAEPERTKTNRMPNANIMTGNNAAVIGGYNGKGVVVAVLDTGLNTVHEAFQDSLGLAGENAVLSKTKVNSLKSKLYGAGVYINAKVPFAYDYADGDTNVADKNGHGTHVSGTVAGYVGKKTSDGGIEYDFVGGAPYAQLLSMKVFKDEGGGTTSDIYYKALEDAYILGADVVNMSLGSQNGFTYDAGLEKEVFGNIYQKMVERGIIMSIAAGNEYSMAENAADPLGSEYTDYGTVASPSTYEGNVSVASVENTAYPTHVLQVGGENITYIDSSSNNEDRWLTNFGDTTTAYVIVTDAGGNISLGYPEDYAGKGVTGKIAVVSRGDLSFETKVENAENAGAIGCIVVNNQPGSISMSIDTFEIPAISVELSALEILMGATNKRIASPTDMVTIDNPEAWKMSGFSNWGTSPMLTLDPTITSVGGDIYSAGISSDDDYVVMSGTSMATPNAAATYANVLTMLKGRNPSMSKYNLAETAKALLYSTAKILPGENGLPYSPRKQGAGLASAQAAISGYQTGAYFTDPIKELGHDPEKSGVYTFEVTVKNPTSKTVTYSDLSATVLTDRIEDGKNTMTAEALDFTATYSVNGANVTSISLAAGKSTTVKVTIRLTNTAQLAVFENGCYIEGFVHFGNIHATFLAYYGDWTQAPIFEQVDFGDLAQANYELSAAIAQGNTYADLLDFYTQPNLAYITNADYSKAYAYAGDNMIAPMPYYYEHVAISTPNSNATSHLAEAIYINPFLLRNAESVTIRITNTASNELLYTGTTNYIPKSYFDNESGSWISNCRFAWNGKKSNGSYVPSGTVANVRITAALPYGGNVQTWSFDMMVDYTAPTVKQTVYDSSAKTLTVTATDANYLQAIYLADTSGNMIAKKAFSSDVKGQSFTATFNVSGHSKVYVACMDYATNETSSLVDLSTVPQAASVTLHTPEIEQTHASNVGATFTFPTLDDMLDYKFVGWATEQIDFAESLTGITYYKGGSTLTLSKNSYTFYSLYAKMENTQLAKALYEHDQADNYTGAWAICGWDYLSNGFDAYKPYALDENGKKLRISTISDAVVDADELKFETDSMNIRYRILSSGSAYTIQNMATGRYLATDASFNIVYLDAVTDYAKWNITKSSTNQYNASIINVGNNKAAFVYDDETQQFAVLNNTKTYSGGASASEWFYTLLYRCTNVTQTIAGYTYGAHSHIYVGKVTKPSTCLEEGIMTYTCESCADSYDEPIPVSDHTEAVTPAIEPTCTEKGATEGKHCSVCGEILVPQSVIDALGHDYDSKLTAPTCTASGYTTYTCTVCGESHTADEVPALGHSEVIDEGSEPDCLTPGKTDGKHCSVCGEVLLEQQVAPALGHSYEAVVTAPTCTSSGYTTYTCTVCANSYVSNRVSSTGHSYDAVVTAPTCTSSGYTTYTCTVCANSYVSNRVSATGHSYQQLVTAPTCTQKGFTTNICTVCQHSYTSDERNALGHSYLYTDNGKDHSVSCANCSFSEIAEHAFTDGKCLCGAFEQSEPTTTNDLSFTMNISAGAEMVVSYSFLAATVQKYSDFYLEVSKEVYGGERVVTIYTAQNLESVNHPTTGAPLIYNASYTGINAKEMGDSFATTLYAIDANGRVYRSETVVSSIKDFLLSKIDKNAIPELNTMAVDMLKYGAAAQLRFGYNTENLVTDALSAEQLAYATEGTPEAVNRFSTVGNGVNVNTNITVGSKVELSLSCIASVADASAVRCVIIDENHCVLATPEVTNKAGVMFSAKFDNVGAKQMRRVITAVFYDGSKVLSKTVTWSVESYVAQVRTNPNTTAEELNMVNAMLIYGDSVAAYLTASGQ